MKNSTDELTRFNDKLFDNLQLEYLSINNLRLDEKLENIIKQSNPLAAIRTANESYEEGTKFFNLLALHSPIICYPFKKHHKVISGVFTLSTIRKAAAQRHILQDYTIPVFKLTKRPSPSLLRSIALFSLTTDLLSKCFISDASKISSYLRDWFVQDEGKRSIFQSQEWVSLYPKLNSTEKVAQYLCISKTELMRK